MKLFAHPEKVEAMIHSTAEAPKKRPRGRKEQIILQAKELFVGNGYPNVTMAQVADQIGITAGALYRHYKNKEHLLEMVFRSTFTHLDEPLQLAHPLSMYKEAEQRIGEQRYVAELWRREARYLSSEYRNELRSKIHSWTSKFDEGIYSLRTDLNAEQRSLITLVLQGWLTLPQTLDFGLSIEAKETSLHKAVQALLTAPLEPWGQPVAQHAPALEIFSTRERLIKAATELFGAQGYENVTLTAIGESAGVTGPNLYSHFESKADLLEASMLRGSQAAWIALDRTLERATSPRDALVMLSCEHLQLAPGWIQARPNLAISEKVLDKFRQDRSLYFTEWVELVLQAKPDLDRGEASLRVTLCLAALGDLRSSSAYNGFTNFSRNISILTSAVLFSD